MSSRIEWVNKSKRVTPYVYALTSETDESVIGGLANFGFKNVFSMLNTEALKKILENAGLEFREAKGSQNELVLFNPDKPSFNNHHVVRASVSDSDSDSEKKGFK